MYEYRSSLHVAIGGKKCGNSALIFPVILLLRLFFLFLVLFFVEKTKQDLTGISALFSIPHFFPPTATIFLIIRVGVAVFK